mmetsp:Transcript_15601/g.25844  ORF Transcript_15601/g.25844 Transcript_15601/m.25844 type:complete len:226 (+) Transcript_15601:125-802(+)
MGGFLHLNPFRLAGDLVHLASFLIIFWKVVRVKSPGGISLKSQELYAIVFITRYLDIFYNFASIYNYVMKLIFLGASGAIVYIMRVRHGSHYDRTQEKLETWYFLVPCFVLALIINHRFTVTEVLWTFSIYLEAVAIVPQLFLLQATGEAENLTADYVFCLGAYRALYLGNWIYRYITEDKYSSQWIVWISGIIQTIIYCDFFYYYAKSRLRGEKMRLPTMSAAV